MIVYWVSSGAGVKLMSALVTVANNVVSELDNTQVSHCLGREACPDADQSLPGEGGMH